MQRWWILFSPRGHQFAEACCQLVHLVSEPCNVGGYSSLHEDINSQKHGIIVCGRTEGPNVIGSAAAGNGAVGSMGCVRSYQNHEQLLGLWMCVINKYFCTNMKVLGKTKYYH